jgi:hypothetical protein
MTLNELQISIQKLRLEALTDPSENMLQVPDSCIFSVQLTYEILAIIDQLEAKIEFTKLMLAREIAGNI